MIATATTELAKLWDVLRLNVGVMKFAPGVFEVECARRALTREGQGYGITISNKEHRGRETTSKL